MARIQKVNMTIDAATKLVRIDYLKGATVTGSDYISFRRLRDEQDGWWFDRKKYAHYDRKLYFDSIVNLNGSPITLSQSEVTALLLDITDRVPDGAVVTVDGALIVMSTSSKLVLTVNGFEEI